ncbi:MAG TPA: MFS transporter [Actinomycetes bacterium]|nr:MFS transporter [Actinomycetes bacterium]
MSPTFRSLRVRNYRRYATGQLLANTGIWMQRVAQDWLVLELTHGSPLALGVTVGLQFLPMLLFGLIGGGLADRFQRRQLLLITSSLMGAMALVLGATVLTGLITVPIVMILAFTLGAIAAIDGPARQAFVSEMVDRDDLPNAVALSTASFNLGRVFGPAIAGLLIAGVGTGWVFVINAFGYGAVVIALRGIRPTDLVSPAPVARDGGELRAGLRYVWSRPELVLVLAVAFFVGTFGLNFQLTIASMTTVTFGLGPAAFGLASTVLALGSLSGSLAAARRGQPRLRLVVLAAVAFGSAAVAVSLMPSYVTFLLALPLVGVAALTLINSAQSFLQLNSAPEMRGRVMGIYTLLFLGGTPIGAPLVGWIASTYGPRWSIALGGIVSAVAALIAAACRLRAGGLGVRAHFSPRPHLHVDTPGQLATLRKGPRIAFGMNSVAAPLAVGALLLLALPTFSAPSANAAQSNDNPNATEIATLQDPRIRESSGMSVSQLHRGVAWIVNDSSNGPYVYGVDESGATVARLTLANVSNRDWEALAPGVDDGGDPALWIGDIGDNDARFESIKLYRISEPTQLRDQQVRWRRYELDYPDGAHNAEALMVDPNDGTIYVVTKEALGAGVYSTNGTPEPGSVTTLQRVGAAPMFVTDGAISPDGQQVALRSYTSMYLFGADAFLHGDDDGNRYGLPRQPQGETLAYLRNGRSVLVGSEGVGTAIYEVQLPPQAAGGTGASASSTGGPSGITWVAICLGGLVILSFGAAIVVARRGRASSNA